ncbi:CHAP domain-containing protein [Cryobacterium psychrotolerans]|uniref:CHAP domain-containing protein n=1 Tax=Cryobacterium psychrotolerans TaxID=386301 RepID=A0A1G9AAU8_9MICO|nr:MULTISPECIES: CHAP domain-containing protein [Cryobacterium]TFD49078.1 CHAP domain-containing protein [Cryobacterium sp. TMT1-2-1]TFD89731.1 CHAP domain-containing protein [Cryobacterium psychrotolerans]SDK24438.1 CHAP domain-containing protein [Cryobacterium psychrotolerans]
MPQPGQTGSPENSTATPTRRELRAQREAGETPEVSTEPAEQKAAPAVSVAPDAARAAARPMAAQPVTPTPAATRPPPSKRNSPLTVAVTLLAIPGLFLTAALPAYAFTPGEGLVGARTAHQRASAEAQDVTVAAGSASISVARDGFSATTTAQLAERERAAAAAAAEKAADAARATTAAYAVYGIRADGDDYPWAGKTSGLSPLGYVYGQCVDFVAWRLNRDAGVTGGNWRWTWSNLTPGGGDASQWANAWSGHGWATGNKPVVGAVAWFNYNHVAYVQSVSAGGSVVLEEYNWMGSSAYHTRTVPASEVPLFLYPPT